MPLSPTPIIVGRTSTFAWYTVTAGANLTGIDEKVITSEANTYTAGSATLEATFEAYNRLKYSGGASAEEVSTYVASLTSDPGTFEQVHLANATGVTYARNSSGKLVNVSSQAKDKFGAALNVEPIFRNAVDKITIASVAAA